MQKLYARVVAGERAVLPTVRKLEASPLLREQPPLAPHLRALYMAFLDLSAQRAVGFAMSPIAVADVEAYLRIHGVADGVRPWVFWGLMVLDRVYMEAMNDGNGRAG